MARKQMGGNQVINVFLYIFGTIGVMALIYILIVMITTSIRNRKRLKMIQSMSPPKDYMQQTGLNCPDYWIRTGNRNNRVYCSNSYNLKQKNDSCKNKIDFREINASQWKPPSSDDPNPNVNLPGVKERCNWLRKCGGTWQGISDVCNN